MFSASVVERIVRRRSGVCGAVVRVEMLLTGSATGKLCCEINTAVPIIGIFSLVLVLEVLHGFCSPRILVLRFVVLFVVLALIL